jgi:hypothetical protein
MALGLTQPLAEISTRSISWQVMAADALGWQPSYLHAPIVLKSGSVKLLELYIIIIIIIIIIITSKLGAWV